jgi:hypothetical protein
MQVEIEDLHPCRRLDVSRGYVGGALGLQVGAHGLVHL